MSSPRTIIEFADHRGFGPERGPAPHKTARIYINGQEVRVAKNGVEVTSSDTDATRVTLELLPDEVRFVREPGGLPILVEGAITADKIQATSVPMSGEPRLRPGDRVRVADVALTPAGGSSIGQGREGVVGYVNDREVMIRLDDTVALVRPEHVTKVEPKPVVQAGWTLESRKRARTKRRAEKFTIHSAESSPLSVVETLRSMRRERLY